MKQPPTWGDCLVLTLPQRILRYTLVVIILRRVTVLRVGRKLDPFQLVAVHEGTGVGTVSQLRAFGDELHADGFHLLLEVEGFEAVHAYGVERVAEVAEARDVDALALCHAGVHHSRNVAQDGLDIGVAHCGNLRQILSDGFRFYSPALRHGDNTRPAVC